MTCGTASTAARRRRKVRVIRECGYLPKGTCKKIVWRNDQRKPAEPRLPVPIGLRANHPIGPIGKTGNPMNQTSAMTLHGSGPGPALPALCPHPSAQPSHPLVRAPLGQLFSAAACRLWHLHRHPGALSPHPAWSGLSIGSADALNWALPASFEKPMADLDEPVTCRATCRGVKRRALFNDLAPLPYIHSFST